MEERIPPPPPPPHPQPYEPSSPKLQVPYIGPGTYVVQVPKDQIYRIPPPENARIAESYRNSPGRDKKRSCSCWCCVCLIIFFVILIIIGALVGGLFSIVLKPKSPRFSIQRFQLKNSTQPIYNITLKVNNPNSNVGINYKEGGGVSLSLKQREIASGAYPSFFQAHDNSKEFRLALKASKGGLPKEVDKSMSNKKKKVNVKFTLSIKVHAQMKMWSFHSGTITYDVTCQVKVDTLAKNTQVITYKEPGCVVRPTSYDDGLSPKHKDTESPEIFSDGPNQHQDG
ncbi:unnamed protein product [Lupinus luteus]|uniref:Late embryogenesis abundant protein LEA-2 subgroup domain-containing protein n=1 Tax=Lupinus luteus TaxID=3873 RepID=A0AAV1XC94_LUPLU